MNDAPDAEAVDPIWDRVFNRRQSLVVWTGDRFTTAGVPGEQTGSTFEVVNPADLAGKSVPIREWIIPDWLPAGSVTLNYGDGGVGKSLLSQQLMTATALGRSWCGLEVLPCRSLGWFAEDSNDELHRRQVDICAAYGANLSDLSAMRWISGAGRDSALIEFDPAGHAHPTPAYTAIRQVALSHGARLLVLDPAADLFPGNENDRHQVRQFIGHLNRLALDIDGAILLSAHPSRSGLSSGNLDGGSTAWSNSVRSRWSLSRPDAEDDAEPDASIRILTRRKANYATIGDTMRLEWRDGALLPEQTSTATKGAPYYAAAQQMFLILLDRCSEQGQFVSHSANAGNYAPRVFGKRPDRSGYTRKDFETAMGELFAQRRILVEDYGRAGKQHSRIARDRRGNGARA